MKEAFINSSDNKIYFKNLTYGCSGQQANGFVGILTVRKERFNYIIGSGQCLFMM